jgi:hypothetical protein
VKPNLWVEHHTEFGSTQPTPVQQLIAGWVERCNRLTCRRKRLGFVMVNRGNLVSETQLMG